MDTVRHGDEDTDNKQLPPPPTGYPHPTHCADLEQLAQDIENTQIRVRRSYRKKQDINKILINISSIVQDKIIENERETGDIITG